jgi:hypothetical protein
MHAEGARSEPSPDDDDLVSSQPDGASERFFDRFYFNLQGAEVTPLVMVGAGVYPGSDVIDGYVILVDGPRQSNHRFSTVLSSTDGRGVGPLRFAMVDPLRTWRLQLGPNPTGVELDVTWHARTRPWATQRITLVAPGGDVTDFSHFFQSGSYEGVVRVADRTYDASGWLGQRDRSRGVRLVTEGGGLHLWVQAQLRDVAISFLLNEGRDHVVTHCDGAYLRTDGSVEPIVEVHHDLTFDDGLDFVSGVLEIRGANGPSDRIEVDGSSRGGYLSGGGYNGWHGRRHGLDHGEGETWPLDGSVSPRTLDVPLTDRPARFVVGDEVGRGVLEFALTRSRSYRYRPS